MSVVHRAPVEQTIENESEPHAKTGIACDRLRQELKKCIKESDCIQKEHRRARECINAHDASVPERCFSLLTSLSDCKRSMIDMRSRFRGRKGDI
ncbi:hypothetical protein AB6A40_000685 [Gnathostoma spinigerum]|uniref:Cytochrome c oxidase assembly factor 5 n=1 Tax=Gnathostoma spinigerum TaxID=75299 RepID=A0ABD6E9B8_9BILA